MAKEKTSKASEPITEVKKEATFTQSQPSSTATAVLDTPVAVAPSPVASFVRDSRPAYAWEEERQKDARKVKGTFRDLECKGGTIKFAFKKHRGDEIATYSLVDGCEYELPLGVVKHLNSLAYHEDAYSKDLISETGFPLKNPNPKKVQRFSFISHEFL